jgi:TRAP-type mannitol/chloroaromatic compound transport system permease small subunit
MNRLLYFIDNLSAAVGKAFAWCILVLTAVYSYEVIVRYVFRNPTAYAFDMSYLMYGALFMMAGAYTLSRDGHVRGDVIYRLWPARVQAYIELTLLVLFLFPGMLALIYAGVDYAAESWSYLPYGPSGPSGEISINSPAGVPVSPLKTILPVAAFLMLVQGVAETIRCVMCIKDGEWPERLHDVEEMEKALLEQHKRQIEQDLGISSDQKEDSR